MIHQYKLNGYNIVLDVYSASVHVTDDMAYDAIALLDKGLSKEEAQKEITEKYLGRQLQDTDGNPGEIVSEKDIADTFADIDALTAQK